MSRSFSFYFAAVAIYLGLAVTGCSQGSAKKATDPAVPVRVVAVVETTVQRKVEAVGSLFALDESIVSSQVDGQIDRVWVDVGDNVKEGQPLVTVDPAELRYSLETQRAAVRQVRAQLGIGPNDPPPADPTKVAFVQRAAADLLDAKQKFERAQKLSKAQLIPSQDFDAAAAKYDNAKAAYDLAIQQVAQLSAQLQASEAQRALAEKKLDDAVVRAPYTGSVKERRVNPGEYLKVQSPVMVLVRTDQLRARLQVPERWAGAVKTGAAVEVRVDAYPNEVFRGKLVRINPSVNPDSRTFEVEGLIPNPDNRLKPGFFVQASLPTEVEEKALVIPGDALVYSYGSYKVYVAQGTRMAERAVKPGVQSNTSGGGVQVEIREGLKAGEKVAVAPPGTTLFDGARISEKQGK